MALKSVNASAKRLPIVLFLGVIVLIPWTIYLAFTLPDNFSAHYWSIAWVGFNIALITVLGFATWAAYYQRQILVAASIVAATLIICDAWFDVIMSLGTSDQLLSIITAVFVEIPLAVFFILLARRIMRRTLRRFKELTGDNSAVWRIQDASLLSSPASTSPQPTKRDR
jgi:hypothetical protein